MQTTQGGITRQAGVALILHLQTLQQPLENSPRDPAVVVTLYVNAGYFRPQLVELP